MPGPNQTKAISGNAEKNDGATVLFGGNIDNENVTNAPWLTVVSGGAKNPGHINEASNWVQKALSAGNFAQMVAGSYIMSRVTSTLAGVANTIFQSGAGDFGRDSVHKIEQIRTVRIVTTGGWTYQDGQPVSATAAQDTFHSISAGSKTTPNDDAAAPTRAIPGEFVMLESFVTFTDNYNDYEAKTG